MYLHLMQLSVTTKVMARSLPWPVGSVEQGKLETFSNAGSLHSKNVGYIIIKKLAARFIEQLQPACEKPRLYSFHSEMHSDRIALVASARQHHRRPEVAHRREMGSPVVRNGAMENRTELGIGSDFCVKTVDQMPDSIIG